MLPAAPIVVVVFFVGGCVTGVFAEDEACYTSGSVAGIVIATVVVTLVMGGLAAAFIWYLWKQRKGMCSDTKTKDKNISCSPLTPEKQLIVREKNDYAFDNPYFKDDETDIANPDAAEKGESGFHVDNGDIAPAQNAKTSNGTTGQHKKNRPFSSLPFHAMFHPSGKKQRATMDDTYISKHLERVTVPLRGHDFTGLGFNICGNMRDGIFVKDVLHRGPASESGKIKAGDRIVGVTVSFSAMVYEDALTILSYASPYDVRLEIEKSAAVEPLPPTNSPKRLGGTSTSFRSSDGRRRLFHPLYRSQSIDDLTQIGKEGFLLGNNSVSGSQRDSGSSATPKRSQSVEASNGGPKVRAALALIKPSSEDSSTKNSANKTSRKSSTSSCESAQKTNTGIDPDPAKIKQDDSCSKKESKSSRFKIDQLLVKSEAPSTKHVPPKPARDISDDKPTNATDGIEISLEKLEKLLEPETSSDLEIPTTTDHITTVFADTDADAEKPTAPPRKAGTPAKRRAPAPPPAPKTEAVIHRADEQAPDVMATQPGLGSTEQKHPLPDLPAPRLPDMQDLPSSQPTSEPDIRSSDNSSLSSRGQKDSSEPSSPEKRKASSLGDLTKLDPSGTHKKTSISSAILERAVSLDLQQSLPGGNLIKQKKILRAPTFEDNYVEDNEGDLNDVDAPILKRWDDGLDKVLGISSHEESKPSETLSNEVSKPSETLSNEVSKPSEMLRNEESKPSEILSNEEIKAIVLQPEEPSDEEQGSLAYDIAKAEVIELDIGPIPDDIDAISSEIAVETQVTSTPARKLIEVKDFLKDDDDSMDDIPYLASTTAENDEEPKLKHSAPSRSSSVPTFSPVTISIPIIKPDLTHYEKLPSPPPASTHPGLDTSWRLSSKTTTTASISSDENGKSPIERKTSKTVTSTDENGKSTLERISVQSLYKPIFSSKELTLSEEIIAADTKQNSDTEALVNGNDSDSSEHYSTAQENDTVSSVENNSTLSLTLSSPTIGNNVAIKAPSNVAGFAKTLIIPGPNEVEKLLNLAQEPDTPPPNLEPPKSLLETN